MKRHVKILFVLIFLLGFNSACVPSVNTTVPTTAATPTVTIPTLMPTVTSMPVSRVDLTCWPVKPLQEGNDIKGSLVYANYAAHTVETNHIFAWDISSFKSKKIKVNSKLIETSNLALISPDGKFIATPSDKGLMLISPNGERLFPLPNEHVLVRDYLPDGLILLVDRQNREDNYQEGIGLTDTYYTLNPTTSEITKHSVFLPGLVTNSKGNFVIQYSPDMKYVLYRSTSEENDIKFTLYDLEKNNVVWIGPIRERSLRNDSYSIPAWRLNASALTIMYYNDNGKNYYSISLDGNVSSVTSFNIDFFESTFSYNSWWSYNAVFPNWSPNGRYLVSSGYKKANSSLNSSMYMSVWDDKEKIGYMPCLPNEGQSTSSAYFTNWSFVDGSHFMVSLAFAPPTLTALDASQPWKIFKSYILDLTNKTIYELPDDNNRGEFATLYKGGGNELLGWVDWEIP